MSQIAKSGASFILSAGDVAYPSGNQANYGDLLQTGTNISDVFAPSLYKNVGDGMPMFGAPGNHGFNSTFLNVWPEPTAPVLSAGRYQMDSYSVPGTTTANYPSAWYAFSVGNARFYVLTAAWANSNVGTGTLYSNDYAAHWTPTSAEYQWLANDLATHPAALKFAVFHFPMYSDNATRDHGHLPARAEQPRGAPHAVRGAVRVQRTRPHLRAQSPAAGRELRVLRHRGRRGDARAHRPARDESLRRLRHRLELHDEQGLRDGGGKPPTSPAQVFSFLLVTVTSEPGDRDADQLAGAVVRRRDLPVLKRLPWSRRATPKAARGGLRSESGCLLRPPARQAAGSRSRNGHFLLLHCLEPLGRGGRRRGVGVPELDAAVRKDGIGEQVQSVREDVLLAHLASLADDDVSQLRSASNPRSPDDHALLHERVAADADPVLEDRRDDL